MDLKNLMTSYDKFSTRGVLYLVTKNKIFVTRWIIFKVYSKKY